jgi:hypothetical protein
MKQFRAAVNQPIALRPFGYKGEMEGQAHDFSRG